MRPSLEPSVLKQAWSHISIAREFICLPYGGTRRESWVLKFPPLLAWRRQSYRLAKIAGVFACICLGRLHQANQSR
eukprot:6201547-Pleurochrysis_carterae.AAC.2